MRTAAADWTDQAARLEAPAPRERWPDALFDRRQNSVRALLSVPAEGTDSLAQTVGRIYDEVVAGAGPRAVGRSVRSLPGGSGGSPAALEEARAAAEVGGLIGGRAGVFTYEGLGPYRYTLMSDDSVRDRYQEHLERLVEYERRRGTALLDTLEAFLDNAGRRGPHLAPAVHPREHAPPEAGAHRTRGRGSISSARTGCRWRSR